MVSPCQGAGPIPGVGDDEKRGVASSGAVGYPRGTLAETQHLPSLHAHSAAIPSLPLQGMRKGGVTTHTRVPGEDPPLPGTATVQPLLGTHHEPPGAKGQECIWCNKRTEAMGAGRCTGSTAGTRGPELFETGMERNNKAVNHDTKHAFILFTKTAWIAKTLQTAFQFNDVESWRDGDLNRREISLFITASAQVLQYYFYFDFNFSKFTKITSRSKPLQLGFFLYAVFLVLY